jgi:antirestriction protein
MQDISNNSDAATRKPKGMIDVFLTNLGKYNEGELCGKWFSLPASRKEIRDALKHIGIGAPRAGSDLADGYVYEEYFITDYESKVRGIVKAFDEYENIYELNHLAKRLYLLDEAQLEKYEAVFDLEDQMGIKGLINMTYEENLDNYDLFPCFKGVSHPSESEQYEYLGMFLLNELNHIDIPENLEPYFDYEAYGRDYDSDIDGRFVSGGYVCDLGGIYLEEFYRGIEDLEPDEGPDLDIDEEPEPDLDEELGEELDVILDISPKIVADTNPSTPNIPKTIHNYQDVHTHLNRLVDDLPLEEIRAFDPEYNRDDFFNNLYDNYLGPGKLDIEFLGEYLRTTGLDDYFIHRLTPDFDRAGGYDWNGRYFGASADKGDGNFLHGFVADLFGGIPVVATQQANQPQSLQSVQLAQPPAPMR